MSVQGSADNGRVEFVTRYETKVHARNLNSDYGVPVVVYATSKQDAVNKAVAVGWSGYQGDARVTLLRVTQEPVVIPATIVIPPEADDDRSRDAVAGMETWPR